MTGSMRFTPLAIKEVLLGLGLLDIQVEVIGTDIRLKFMEFIR